MATRQEIALIYAARAGDANAQLTLGKHYLLGSAGLAKNLPTALHWLSRAAQQDKREAWLLIGEHIPFEVAARSANVLDVCHWYERAFDAGIAVAGLVLAKLLLPQQRGTVPNERLHKAFAALETAANAGIPEAQLYYIEQLDDAGRWIGEPQEGTGWVSPQSTDLEAVIERRKCAVRRWKKHAAENGVFDAQRALATEAWSSGDRDAFLKWAVPAARAIATRYAANGNTLTLGEDDVLLMSHCASAWFESGAFDAHEVECFWRMAAQAGEQEAQFALGLWLARVDENGERWGKLARHGNLDRAAEWLIEAGRQGNAKAWYVLSKLRKRQFGWSQPCSAGEGQHDLERAAEAGHVKAQLELGLAAWQARRHGDDNDVLAAYWLQKAARQGSDVARATLKKVATAPVPAPWAQSALRQVTSDTLSNHPFLVARIEAAALLGLSCPEALLLDFRRADRGHCLVIDVKSLHGRSGRRRLVLIQTEEERRTLNRVRNLFIAIDSGPNGPEGNYQKRLYLFKKVFSLSASESETIFRRKIKQL